MIEKRGRVSRNDALFVRRKNPDRQLRVDTFDPLFVILVRILVERCAEPAATGDDFTPSGSIVLANAAREDQTVQASKCRRKGPDLADNPVDEKVDRFSCLWLPGVAQHTHVCGNARDA